MKSLEKFMKTKKPKSPQDFNRNNMMESAMTQSEKQLWVLLDKLKVQKQFKRQYTFKYFIIDFFSEELKIAIELDSKTRYHNKEVDAIKKQLLDDFMITQIIIQKEDLRYDEKKVLEELRKGILERGKK